MAEKPLPVLDEMPLHVKKMIFGNLEFQDKARCRLVSKSIKSVIESSTIVIPSVRFLILDASVDFNVHNYRRVYTRRPHFCTMRTGDELSERIRTYNDRFSNIMDFAIHDFKKILNTYRHVEIKKFILETICPDELLDNEREYINRFKRDFAEGSLKVSEFVAVGITEEFTDFMKILEPGFLRQLGIHSLQEDTQMYDIVELECFKRLKALIINSHSVVTGIEPDDIKHLEYCHVRKLVTIDAEDVVMLREEVLRQGARMILWFDELDMIELAGELGPPNIERGWEFKNGHSALTIVLDDEDI